MKLKFVVTTVVAMTFAGMGMFFSSIYAAKSPQVSDELFATKLATVPAQANGSVQSLDGFRAKVLVVNFWATWCAPCVKEMPELSAMQTELAAKNISFIGIGIDSPDALAEFAQKYKISYPLFVGGMSGTDLSTHMGNKAGGLPFTVLLNKSGDIVKTYRGKLDMVQLRKDILAVK